MPKEESACPRVPVLGSCGIGGWAGILMMPRGIGGWDCQIWYRDVTVDGGNRVTKLQWIGRKQNFNLKGAWILRKPIFKIGLSPTWQGPSGLRFKAFLTPTMYNVILQRNTHLLYWFKC